MIKNILFVSLLLAGGTHWASAQSQTTEGTAASLPDSKKEKMTISQLFQKVEDYTRLLTIGVATMVCYPVMMYFLIDPGLNIEALYLPCFLRSFGNAIFFCMLTVYLEELMPFQHFFMGLTMAGIIRNGPMSAMCSGLYSFGLRYQMADNMSRSLPYDATNLLMLSIRNLYGITCIIGLAVLLIFLLWDVQPVRSTLKKMPAWNFVGRKMKKASR